VEQGRVGEHAVETTGGQIEREEILLPHLASAVGARHRGELRRPFETDRDMAARGEGLEVAARPAAEIEQREGRRTLDVSEQRRDILAHVMVARALPELRGAPVVMVQREGARFFPGLANRASCLHSARTSGSEPAPNRPAPMADPITAAILRHWRAEGFSVLYARNK